MTADRPRIPTGTTTPSLTVVLSCPTCGGTLTYDNGVIHRHGDVGTVALSILSCPAHGPYEMRVSLQRADIPRQVKRPSGAEQRRRARERAARPATTRTLT